MIFYSSKINIQKTIEVIQKYFYNRFYYFRNTIVLSFCQQIWNINLNFDENRGFILGKS